MSRAADTPARKPRPQRSRVVGGKVKRAPRKKADAKTDARAPSPGPKPLPVAQAAATAPATSAGWPQPRRPGLLTLHRLILDRLDAGPERVSTANETALDDLTVAGPGKASAHGYRPTPRRVVRWALEGLPADVVRQSIFVDFGSGRGRAVFEAARLPFRRILGVEFAEELHDDAVMNLRHWPRSLMACRDVEFLHADVATVALPAEPLVVYLFDPFNERMTTRIAARLAEHGRRHGVHVVLVAPDHAMAFRESPAFKPVELPAATQRAIRLFSPYDVEIYSAAPGKRS